MRHRRQKRPFGRAVRFAAPVLAVPAIALSLTMIGTTVCSSSATEASGHDSVTTTTVTLTNSAIATCPVTGLLPNGNQTKCTFTTSYAGPSAAYLAVNVLVETQAGAGGTALYHPSDGSNDLNLIVTSTSPAVTYTLPTTATTCPGNAPSGSTCYELDNELISTTAVTSATVYFTVSVGLPTTSTTGSQGGAAQIVLTTHAAQSGNNTLSCTATATAGSPCTASGTFKWS
jgi:hypothetical protein